jgi:metal-responsive CopG/Arc/MetJ family transcriptional regulator
MNLIKSFLNTDFADNSCSVHDDTCKCCEVILFSGDAAQVRAVHNSFRTIKHVEESLVFLA